MKNTKAIYYIRAAIIGFVSLFGVSVFFISSSALSKFLATSLKLKVNPSMTGGELAAEIFDDTEDDKGAGNLVYPANSQFEKGSMDLIRYGIHRPVYNGIWQSFPDYWQFDLEFKGNAKESANIMIYFGMDSNKEEGESSTLFENAENVSFSKPWHYAVWISEGTGKIYNVKKEMIGNAQLSFSENGNKIQMRIPLEIKELQKIYTAENTWHYVLVGGYSKWDRGGFMPVEKRKSYSKGSVAKGQEFHNLIPKVYDILGENSQLGNWNDEELKKAELNPVEVNMQAKINSKDNKNRIEEIKKIFYEQYKREESGNIEYSEEFFEKLLKENPEDPVALAYYGSFVAMRGGKANVAQAVKLVNEAFTYLDKAVELGEGHEKEIDILLNRASVSKAVPNGVFAKAETGAKDFAKAAALQKQIAEKSNEKNDFLFAAYLYVSSSECYNICGKETEAALMLNEAEKMMAFVN
ncbi:MAG: hypothetical protein MJ185_05855 [Treponema sp.]|nr:hypothetical protein [Treponema sp.]